GRHGRSGSSAGATTVERWRLYDRVIFLAVWRDHIGDDVLGRIILVTLPDSDLHHEVHAVEVLQVRQIGCACLCAHDAFLYVAGGLHDLLTHGFPTLHHVLLSLRCAGHHHVVKKLAPCVCAIDENDFEIDELTVALA